MRLMKTNLTVLLTTEGTYPFHQGGVSTWCDMLVKEMKGVDYILYSVLTNPFISQKFHLPTNSKLVKVPLWGTEEPCEHLDIPFSLVYLKKKRTTSKVIKTYFLPLFKRLINEIIIPHKNPQIFGEILYQLYLYFQEYEYKESFKSEEIWKVYKEFILDSTKSTELIDKPDIYSLIQSLGWVYRFLNIVNTNVPKSDVTHSSASAFCGIPCVISKLENKVPFLLTEHGVYLREQYLSLSKRNLPPFLNTFLIRFIQSITTLNYYYADQVSPVCHYNTRWEKRFGVEPQNLEVIYNGIDPAIFTDVKNVKQSNPTVVTVARIDPIKDILSLISAAAIVKQHIPNVKFIVYGSVTVQSYYEECLAFRSNLKLEDTFMFAGHVSDMASAYQSGDVIALSSISEAFPYSVVEAMMTGKPVVSTDVGGVREAIGDTGFLVTPREPEEMAASITKLLKNKELRIKLGSQARKRALSHFTLDKVLDHHLKSYRLLANSVLKVETNLQLPEEKEKILSIQETEINHSEIAYDFYFNGDFINAINHFSLAISTTPLSPAVLIFIAEMANCYLKLGQKKKAENELAKLVLLKEIKPEW
jgi:polysaccharide biosynthesis protein PelF